MKRKRISETTRQIIFARDRWTCQYCGKQPDHFIIDIRKGRPYIIPVESNNKWFEIDHIVPVKVKDNVELNNLITSCWKCNSVKSSRIYKVSKNFPLIKLYKCLK
jgi:5-methylcytosine-specific restriction endonuclease McrA